MSKAKDESKEEAAPALGDGEERQRLYETQVVREVGHPHQVSDQAGTLDERLDADVEGGGGGVANKLCGDSRAIYERGVKTSRDQGSRLTYRSQTKL